MPKSVEIDPNSGFCGGVIRAISRAEEYLDNTNTKRKLYSLGSIVHNEAELMRLESKGLTAIGIHDIPTLTKGSDVFIRAHGEPPSTYRAAEKAGVNIIDCTCPVVLKLQKSIREAYGRTKPAGGQIIIFGKVGHAEVLGLLGQVDGDALVIENMSMLQNSLEHGEIDLQGPVEIFSQTTKSPAGYAEICSHIENAMAKEHEMDIIHFRRKGLLTIHNTICQQVAGRHAKLSEFALAHDIIIFVSGKDSSNGKVLCELCKSLNIRTYQVSKVEDVRQEWFRRDDRVGICGATSTPKWLLESVAQRVREF